MTEQVVWTFRKFFFLQFDTKFASKQQRLAKIDTILWLLLSTQISEVWHNQNPWCYAYQKLIYKKFHRQRKRTGSQCEIEKQSEKAETLGGAQPKQKMWLHMRINTIWAECL